MWLPQRLHERDGTDVDRIRDAVADRHRERCDRTIRFDHRLRAGGRHVGEPRRRGELPQERRIGLDVDRASVDRHPHGGAAPPLPLHGEGDRWLPPAPRGEGPPRAHGPRDRAAQPAFLGLWVAGPAVRRRPLSAGSRFLLLLSGGRVYLNDGARLSGSPSASIKSGATSSTGTVSNTSSRTRRRCTGFASSIATFRRAPSTSFRPGIRAPPPVVYTRDRPPAERDAVARKAAARSTPTAISSPRALT